MFSRMYLCKFFTIFLSPGGRMPNDYTSYDSFEISLEDTTLLEKLIPLREIVKTQEKTIQKESAWIQQQLQSDRTLENMKITYEQVKLNHTQSISTLSVKRVETRQMLHERLEKERQAEIDKINAKYDSKVGQLDTLVDKYLLNEIRKETALHTKLSELDSRIKTRTDGLYKELEPKKSKTLVNAETELEIAQKQISVIEEKRAAISTELQRRREKRRW